MMHQFGKTKEEIAQETGFSLSDIEKVLKK